MSRNGQELRVLSGIHAGARAPLPDAEATIGSASNCDFILSDEGVQAQHARLVSGDGGWTVHWLQDPSAIPVRLAPGAGLALGPVVITLTAANAAWPDELPAATQQAMSAPAEAVADVVGEEHSSAVESVTVHAAVQVTASQAKKPRILFSAVLVAALAAALAFAWVVSSPKPHRPAPALVQPATDPNAMRERIMGVLAELVLGQRVSVESDGNGGFSVQAILVSDEEAEALATALSRLSPRPLLRISTENDLRQSVSEAVERHAIELQSTLSAKYLGEGRFRVDGKLASESEREALLSNLRAQFPQVRSFESGLLTPEGAAGRMVADLQAAGLAQVQGRWRDGRLWLDVRLSESDIPRWEQTLARVAARHALPFSAHLELLPAPPAGTTNIALPFRLHSVVSGNTPYVVLADGTKLLIGGNRLGWQLAEVTPQRVVFEGAGGRRIEVPR